MIAPSPSPPIGFVTFVDTLPLNCYIKSIVAFVLAEMAIKLIMLRNQGLVLPSTLSLKT